MSVSNNTPNFIAGSDIYPFRAVSMFPGQPMTLRTAPDSGGGYPAIGITDGSVSRFNKVLHAQNGEVVSLQNGRFVQVTAGGSITAGDQLRVSNGVFLTSFYNSEQVEYQACENANNGEVFWAVRIGAFSYPAV